MSKKKNDYENDIYDDFKSFFNYGSPLIDDENDEDYCYVEDILTNSTKYKNDELPYSFSIPKREVDDIMNDQKNIENVMLLNEENNNSSLSAPKSTRSKNKSIGRTMQDGGEMVERGILIPEKKDEIQWEVINEKDNDNDSSRKNHGKGRPALGKRKVKSSQNKKKYKKINEVNNEIPNSKDKLNCGKSPNSSHCEEFSPNKKVSDFIQFGHNSSFMSSNNHSIHQYFAQPGNNITNNNNTNGMQNRKPEWIEEQGGLRSFGNSNPSHGLSQLDFFEQISLLLKQYDFIIQLLIQNFMLTNNQNVKFRCYNMIFSYYMARLRIIDNFRIPEFDVKFNFNRIFNANKDMKLRLQVSFFQPPILEILPMLTKFINKKEFSKDEVCKILKEFFPFINPLYLPITNKIKYHRNRDPSKDKSLFGDTIDGMITWGQENSNDESCSNVGSNINSNAVKINHDTCQPLQKSSFIGKKLRRKFDQISDHLLLIGLNLHGKKNIDTLKDLWLDNKSVVEIKHRIKNLTCQSAPENVIKKWKIMSETPLSGEEFLGFLKGIQWFGCKKKWKVISRYYLPERSPEFLEEFYNLLFEKGILSSDSGSCDPILVRDKKRKQFSLGKGSTYEEALGNYVKYYSDEIKKTFKEITNLSSKVHFYTPDDTYESFSIPDKIKYYNDNYITTRNKHNKTGYTPVTRYGNSSSCNSNTKAKSSSFDFHIVNGDDGAFEKISI